ncbi:MAG: zinc-binding alcohol dehydrogenase [Armatimonadetes bacterium]|nr:zinc-binding alcohol dehydrogenase [Armatimonadota bacterium]
MSDIPDARRCVLVHGDGSLSVGERPLPEMGPKEILVKTAVSLISAGTETSGIKGRRANPAEAEPHTTGYSTAGTVIAVGDEVTEFEVGDRVIGMAGECYNHCDYNVGHPQVATHIPEGVSFDDAVMVCLAATSLQAVRRVDPKLGEFIAVVGQGLVGQFADQLLALSGARVAAIDLDDRRLEVAAAHGAEITINPEKQDMTQALVEWADGVGIDGALVAYGGDGSKVLPALAAAMLKAPDTHQVGRIAIVGGIKAEMSFPTAYGNLNILPSSRTGPGYHDPEYHMGQDYPRAYVRWTTRRNMDELLRLIDTGAFRVSDLITHRFPFEQAPEAYDTIIAGREHTLGVLLQYE